MNRKLTAALGILVLIAVIHHFIKNSASGIKPFSKIKEVRMIEIDNMEIGDKFRLMKSPSGWEIIISTNYPADSRRCRVLAAELKKLTFETVISLSRKKRFENALSSSSAIKLTVSGKKPASVLIGKQAFDRNHFYAGFENGEKSYLAGGIRRELLLTGADYYRNRRLASIKENAMPEDFYKAVSYCLNMTASGFYDDNFASTHRVEITKSDGMTFVWEFGEAQKNKFCGRVPGENGSYIIPMKKAEKIIKFLLKNGTK